MAAKVNLRVPECFGGGGQGELPVWPFWTGDAGFIYGAPDGFKDGVIIVQISARDSDS